MAETKPAFLKRVHIENFKSIRHCDVELQPLTLLVGPNGSGKTNFLDALRFVGELLRRPPEEAVRILGGAIEPFGIPAVFRQQPFRAFENRNLTDDVLDDLLECFLQNTPPLAIELEFNMPSGQKAAYVIRLAWGLPTCIREERCEITDKSGMPIASYRMEDGEVVSTSLQTTPPAFKDRPYLISIAPFPPFDSVFQSLQSMQFYCIQPNSVREHPTTVHNLLNWNGSGLASVFGRISRRQPEVKERLDDYLRAILPSLRETRLEPLKEIAPPTNTTGQVLSRLKNMDSWYLRFLFGDSQGTLEFEPASMSDGTLHALGVLVALFQCRDLPAKSAIPLVAIEEPEANLHPGAAEVLMDAMTEATTFTQVMATTHSPDFLDYPDLDPESLLVFDASGGETLVAKADDASMSAICDKLYSAGELLRLDQLRPRTAGATK
ncbi:MAG: AAA family ATPase [Pirellulales bacterium]|nr:AAA family ATPase [Pirellulales bacterium]